MNRRTLLRSLAGTTVGLPFLEEMAFGKSVKSPEIPIRAFNLFFGLGIPSPLQTEGFAGPMAPLKPPTSSPPTTPVTPKSSQACMGNPIACGWSVLDIV